MSDFFSFKGQAKINIQLVAPTSIPSLPSAPLPKAFLYREGNDYFFGLETYATLVPFTIPTIADILSSCKVGGKKPPTKYLMFRKPIQKCLALMSLRFERTEVSKISSLLWKNIDSDLRTIFQKLYDDVKSQWKKNRLIFEFFKPLVNEEIFTPLANKAAGTSTMISSDASTPITPVEEKNQGHQNVTWLAPITENKPKCKLSSIEEIQLTNELFSGLAYIPGFNYHLGSP